VRPGTSLERLFIASTGRQLRPYKPGRSAAAADDDGGLAECPAEFKSLILAETQDEQAGFGWPVSYSADAPAVVNDAGELL